MLGKRFSSALAATVLIAASGTAGAAANFDNDVAASIDLGLAWFASAGCYSAPYSCGDATGLALLALLEKRPAADADSQGYAGASEADKTRMRSTVRYIINQVNAQGTSFYSYRDGGYMMALSVYMRTGGVDKDDGPTSELDGAPLTLKQTLDTVFDRIIANQMKNNPDGSLPYPANNGYWCYTGPDCRDSSTTQLVIGGLVSARGVYLNDPYKDNARLAQLDAATQLARQAYERNGTPGGACTATVPANEKGHGYNAGSANSIQQTASGLWIQLGGGSSLNNSNVQGYMRWLQNRYRWADITAENIGDSYGYYSYWYYLWSSFKAYQFLADSKAVPNPGNLGVADIGTLPAASDPACASRQMHRDPDALPRVALFGADGPGYYGEENERVYFDYAYTIMGHQCADGFYNCNGAPGRWDNYAEQAYALLVLQRSVGGGCLDSDRDGICDSGDDVIIEPPPSGGLYCDRPNDSDTRIDNRDLAAIITIMGSVSGSVQVTPANAWANYKNDSVINRHDYDACKWVMGGRLPKKYY
jgi:hypothetical protein